MESKVDSLDSIIKNQSMADTLKTKNLKSKDRAVRIDGNFKIVSGEDCAIEFGRIQISKAENGQSKFRIDVSNKNGHEGAVSGVINFTSVTEAYFSKSDCKKISFKFLPDGKLNITETECSNYHGTNICFDGVYIYYKEIE
ncbi:MAG: hypothetical protein JNM67_07970 [Bacteroidetes bacterium]|nr:hypothetical protein [Bacteroidota bacterium]